MSAETKIPVWLDCDPGHDDAFAILLLAHHPLIKPLGISTIHGNSSLPHTTHNALSLLTAFSAPQIPVYPGASAGLSRPAVHAPSIHGASGLDGTSLLPVPTISAKTKTTSEAITAMASALLSTKPQTTWLVATGALTNIALLFQSHPEVAKHLKGVSIMGGAIGDEFTSAPLGIVDGVKRIGNWSVWAEFNILVDPEAAHLIFSNSDLRGKITLIPLDLTHLVLATPRVQDLLLNGRGGEGESKLRRMLVELLTFFAETYKDVFGISEGPPLHDPLAVAVVLGDEHVVFEDEKGGRKERFEVSVVTEGTHEDALKGAQTGRTIVKLLGEGEEGVRIPRGVDVGRFWEVVEGCLERADEAGRGNRFIRGGSQDGIK